MDYFHIIYKMAIRYYNIHALLLWLLWSLFSIVLIGSARWWRHHPKVMATTHALIGSLIIGLTIWLGMRASFHLKSKGMHLDAHAISGLAILVSSIVPALTGGVVSHMRTHQTWKTKLLLKFRSWHKVTGYLMILIA